MYVCCIYISLLIPLPVSNVYSHHREGYIQFKTLLHKVPQNCTFTYFINVPSFIIAVCSCDVCLYVVSIFVPYIIPTVMSVLISYLIYFLCPSSCVVGPFFGVKLLLDLSALFVSLTHPHPEDISTDVYYVLVTFPLFSVALRIWIFITVAVCLVWRAALVSVCVCVGPFTLCVYMYAQFTDHEQIPTRNTVSCGNVRFRQRN
jgi:hypothetical protein